MISVLSQAGTAWLREKVLHDPRELNERVGRWAVAFLIAPLKTEQDGVFFPDSVSIDMLCHITHARVRPVAYGCSFLVF